MHQLSNYYHLIDFAPFFAQKFAFSTIAACILFLEFVLNLLQRFSVSVADCHSKFEAATSGPSPFEAPKRRILSYRRDFEDR